MTAVQVRRTASTLLEGLLVAAIAVTALLGVVRPILGTTVLGLAGGSFFGRFPSVGATLDPDEVRVETTPRLPSLATRGEIPRGDALEMTLPTRTVVAVYQDLDARQMLGLVGSEILAALLTMAVLVCLLMLVRSLRRGDPFVPANARRLYIIAAAVGFGGQAVLFLQAWGRSGVLAHPAVAPYVVHDAHMSVMPLLAGLAIAVGAEVFRQGTALREEVEGLV